MEFNKSLFIFVSYGFCTIYFIISTYFLVINYQNRKICNSNLRESIMSNTIMTILSIILSNLINFFNNIDKYFIYSIISGTINLLLSIWCAIELSNNCLTHNSFWYFGRFFLQNADFIFYYDTNTNFRFWYFSF